MARSLNKSRILISKLVGLFVVLAIFFSYGFIPDESVTHEAFDIVGLLMVSFCALGRLYCTAFLGGSKNKKLITEGPFSIARNPLYVFSWIGFTGVALMTNHLVLIVGVPVVFAVLYWFLVQREEQFLQGQFGDAYTKYKKAVPRFFPKFSAHKMSADITVNAQLLKNGAMDAIWWFAAYPIVEFAEYLHDIGVLKPFFLVP